MKKTALLLTMALLSAHAMASAEVVDGITWTYTVSEGEATLVYPAVPNDTEGVIAIPSHLGGYPVTVIGEKAFYNCYGLTGVTLPSSMKGIAGAAFHGCYRIASMTLPSGVETIWDGAFQYCRSLKDVYFKGNAVPNEIGVNAFNGCHGDLIMHVPLAWQGRGRTLCGYSIWKGNRQNDIVTNYVFSTVTNHIYHHDVVTDMTAYHTTVTNVYVHYVNENAKPTFVFPSSYDTGFVNVVAEVEGGFAVIPATWSVNYPGFTEKYGSDFSKALNKPNGKYDRHGNPMFVWQDYVAGTSPMDVNDVFDATIAIEGGQVVVSHTPVLDEERAALRKYTVYGKKNLMDSEWKEVEPGEELDYNFYRVTVRMK